MTAWVERAATSDADIATSLRGSLYYVTGLSAHHPPFYLSFFGQTFLRRFSGLPRRTLFEVPESGGEHRPSAPAGEQVARGPPLRDEAPASSYRDLFREIMPRDFLKHDD